VTPEQLESREKLRLAAEEKAAKEADRLAAIEASKNAVAAPVSEAPTEVDRTGESEPEGERDPLEV